MAMRLVGIIILAILVSACSGGSNTVSAITPLPEQAVSVADTSSDSETNNTDANSADVFTNHNGVVGGAYPTPAVEFAGLEPGVARDIAVATDTAMMPEIDNPLTFNLSPVPITFSEFYSGYDIQTGLIMSDKLLSLDGQQVVMEGYVAPPLKPEMDFFVLTRIPLAVCPFCTSEAAWPNDITLVYLPEQQLISSVYPVRVEGRMEIGSSIDAETGMVSLVRIYAETIEGFD